MKLVFLHSSDIHGFLLPTDYQTRKNYSAPFSLSRVSSAIKAEKAKYGAKNVIVTDSGDCLQGSPLAAYVHSTNNYHNLNIFIQAYNQIGYDAKCLGNHDFNFGLNYLKYYIDNSKTEIINDNILDEKSQKPAFGEEYKIINKNDIKVGILGITTQYIPHWEPKKNLVGLKFGSAFEQIKHYVQVIKSKVDILAVVYHGGFENNLSTGQPIEPHNGENEGYEILKKIPEIDVLLSGHQHRRINIVTKNTAIVQPGYRGETIGKVVLNIDTKTKKIKNMTASLINTANYAPDPKIIEIVKRLDQNTQLWLDHPLARLKQPALIEDAIKDSIKGAPFINLIQQMQLWFTNADISATAVMSETAHGFNKEITMRDVLLNYPYANQLCQVKLTGKELRRIIEHSLIFLEKNQQGKIKFNNRLLKPNPMLYYFDVFYPLKYEADISKPEGMRLTKVTLHGKPLEDKKIYHLAVNNYRAMGGGFYPEYSVDKVEFSLDKSYVQMFSEYLTHAKIKVDTKRNYNFY